MFRLYCLKILPNTQRDAFSEAHFMKESKDSRIGG